MIALFQNPAIDFNTLVDPVFIDGFGELKKLRFQDDKNNRAIATVLTAMDAKIEIRETELDKVIQIREGAMNGLLAGRVRLNV